MKRADVIIAGLVVLGVFGLVFAGQTFSTVRFSSQSGGGVAVGVACVPDTILPPRRECYVRPRTCTLDDCVVSTDGCVVDAFDVGAQIGSADLHPDDPLGTYDCPPDKFFTYIPCVPQYGYDGSDGFMLIGCETGTESKDFFCPSGSYFSWKHC